MNTDRQCNDPCVDRITDKLDQLIAAVLDTKLTPKLRTDSVLWNTAEIANYLGVTYKYTSEYIITHHTFPCAMRVPTKNGKKGHPRWYAGEVIAWVAKHREA